jgi:hypothetical protein
MHRAPVIARLPDQQKDSPPGSIPLSQHVDSLHRGVIQVVGAAADFEFLEGVGDLIGIGREVRHGLDSVIEGQNRDLSVVAEY